MGKIKRKQPGPAKTGIPFIARFPRELLRDLDQLAADTQRSRAEMLRAIVREWIADKCEPVEADN